MPVITLEASTLTKDQKCSLIREFTTTASEIMKIPQQAFTVIIRENNLENIGSGGKPLCDR